MFNAVGLLDYAPPRPWYRGIRWRRWIVLCVLLAAAGAACRFGDEIGTAARYWHRNHRCHTYCGPAGQVVYECDRERGKLLLRDGQPMYGFPLQLIPPENQMWADLATACSDHAGWRTNWKTHAPLLMHELRTPRGRRALVLVTYGGFGSDFPHAPSGTMVFDQTSPYRGRVQPPPPGTQPEAFVSGELLTVEVLTPSVFSAPTRSRGQQIMVETQRRLTTRQTSFFADPQKPEDVIQRIYAGQLDPEDPAHFTIDYDTPAGRRTFDGRLQEDGTVAITRR